MHPEGKTNEELACEIAELRARLAEAEGTLDAIRHGEVDALLISTAGGERVYTLEGADHTYRILVESMQQGAATLLEDGSIFYSNQHLARLLKTPLQQLIGASIHTFVHSADAPLFADLVKQARQCRSEGELRLETADGVLIPVYVALNRLELGERMGLCLAVTDLTAIAAAERLALANAKLEQEVSERKRAEEALRESESRFRSLFENSADAVFLTRPDGRVVAANPAACAMFGMTEQEILQVGRDGLMAPDDPRHAVVIEERRRTGRITGAELTYRRKNGQTFPGEVSSVIMPGEDGPRSFVIVRDITERKGAEDALQASKERLRLALEAGVMATWDAHVPSGLTIWNEEHFRMLGYAPGTVTPGYPAWADRVHPEDLASTQDLLQRSLDHGGDYCAEFRTLWPDGTVRWLETRGRVEHDAAGQPLRCYGVMLDTTARKQAENALRESQERLRSVLENSLDAAYRRDLRTDTYDYLSPVMEQVMGLSPEQMRNMSVQEIVERIHPEDRERVEETIREGMRSHKGRVEYRFRQDDGQYRWMADHFIVQTAADGLPILRSGTVRDVTEQKQAEAALRESEERFRAFIDSNVIGILFGDVDGRVYDCNAELARIIGRSRQEVLAGKVRWTDITPPEDLPLDEQAIVAAQATGRCTPYEKHYIRPDGSCVPVVVGYTLLEPQRQRSVAFILDITDRKRMEDALREVNLQLAEADRRKDEFLAMLAHELRNPLAPVRNAVQILRAVGSKEVAAQRQKDVIDRQVTHMSHLLDDLLDVSRVTRGKINLERQPLPLIDVLAHAIEIVTPLIQHRRHELTYTPPTDMLLVEGDLDRLAQVFGNLLTNAANYTDEGGRIGLEAACEDGQVVVRVRDNGVGIAADLLPHVFDLFAQADHSMGRAQGGLGIGLTMVQQLVKMHGGTVEARSAGLGKGSEFIVRLPALAAEPASEMMSPTIPTQFGVGVATARRVLIVDDIIDSAESLAELLGLWGHETQTAHSGATALDWARWFRPEVVLLDIGMPGMDGFEVARRLRQIPEMAGAVLVALTGYGQTQDREATRAAGFNHHLVKPVDLDALRVLLENSADELNSGATG